jgi:hypothetical protein
LEQANDSGAAVVSQLERQGLRELFWQAWPGRTVFPKRKTLRQNLTVEVSPKAGYIKTNVCSDLKLNLNGI